MVMSGRPTMTITASPKPQFTSTSTGKALIRDHSGQNTGQHGWMLVEPRRKDNAAFAAGRFAAQLNLALLLHYPLIGWRPSLRVRLVVAVPMARASQRVQIVAPLYQGHMPVAKQNIITLEMGGRKFFELIITVQRHFYFPVCSSRIVYYWPRVRDHEHLAWCHDLWFQHLVFQAMTQAEVVRQRAKGASTPTEIRATPVIRIAGSTKTI